LLETETMRWLETPSDAEAYDELPADEADEALCPAQPPLMLGLACDPTTGGNCSELEVNKPAVLPPAAGDADAADSVDTTTNATPHRAMPGSEVVN
jgi:hypothetical protein